MRAAEIVVCCSLTVIAYVYFGYPAILWVSAVMKRPQRREVPPNSPIGQPRLSFLVPAHNEEATIGAKLKNLLALDYPRDSVEILVGDDGSSDRTAEIVRRFAAEGIGLVSLASCEGKSAVQNRLAACASGEILVFTDADCLVAADAAALLVENFADPHVGLVTGRAAYVSGAPTTIAGHESVYLR